MDKKESNRQPILLAGPGAIGGITAAFLRKAGYPVTVLTRTEDSAMKIRREGLEISGIRGEFRIPVPAVSSVASLEGNFTTVLLATKAYDAVPLVKKLLPVLTEDSVVVTMQNGIVEDAVAEVVGMNRVVSCVVGWGATMHGTGKLEMTSEGEFVVGRLDGSVDARILEVRELLSSILPVEVSANIRGNLYSKLIINSCITSLGALSGLTLGRMLAMHHARRLFIAIMQEAMKVAEAMNIRVEVYAGKVNYYKVLGWTGLTGNFRRHFLIRLIGLKYRRLKSSSLQSLERGKPTEINYLNGYIVDRANELQIPVPLNTKIVEMVREIEAGKRRIRPENLREL